MDKLEEAKLNGVAAANNAKDLQELDAVRVNFLGKKGEFAAFMRELGKLSAQERPQRGAVINEAKQAVVEAVGPGTEKEKIIVKPGEKILYDKYAGTGIKIDGEDYLILKNCDIIAVVE